VRFARPDLRDQLDEDEAIDDIALFQELQQSVLTRLAAGDILVLNLGLVEPLGSTFYRYLLKVREATRERGAQLVLCRLSPEHIEIFELFSGFRIFQVASTEAQAVREADALPTRGNCNAGLIVPRSR
jgi:anti-anti-sigma regulatory factor